MKHKEIKKDGYTQIVKKLGFARFSIWWVGVSDSQIEMDFRPLLTALNLKPGDDALLVHWQAKPKGLRQWGAYDVANDSYHSSPGLHEPLPDGYYWQRFQIDERIYKVKPTAVLVGIKVK